MTSSDRPVRLTVNGTAHALRLPASTPLLPVLRNDLGLNGPKFGCGLGECGSCAVLKRFDDVSAHYEQVQARVYR